MVLFIQRLQCVACAGTLAAMLGMAGPAVAQSGSGGLQGSRGLDGAREVDSGTGGLRPARLHAAGRQPASRLEGAPARPSRLHASRTDVERTAVNLARGGLSTAELEGAASSIPPSQIGALLFDVARELEAMQADMTDVAVGYYMAALADPQGHRYGEAKRRLHEIFLNGGLSHEEAVRLYDGGKSILKDLSEPRIGLTRDGLASGRRDLEELKAAYHQRRRIDEEARDASPDSGSAAARLESE